MPPLRLECQIALALKLFFLPSMNGFGLRPLPAAISSMLRPEATERSCARMLVAVAFALIAVVPLDQQPVGALAALAVMAQAHEHPAALQLLADQREFELALAQRLGGIAVRGPEAAVPQHHRAAAILALGDGAFEVAVVERVVLGLDGKALVLGVEREALGDGPGLEDAIELEAQVIVQARGGVLLDDKAGVLGGSDLRRSARLRRLREIALALVEGKLAGHDAAQVLHSNGTRAACVPRQAIYGNKITAFSRCGIVPLGVRSMAARAYWKGYLKLSLVTCPVALYPASSKADKTRFHQINKKTGHRLRQQMVDEETGRVVDKDNKGRGYELTKGKFVEIEPEEIDAIEFENTHTIDIDKFVPEEEIDKRYYERPYYIVPDGKSGEEAFAVIRDAMKDKGRVALAGIIFANRQHILAIEPWGKGMLGTTLRYDYEVRDEKEFFKGIGSHRVPKEMVSLASHILDTKAGHFDPGQVQGRV